MRFKEQYAYEYTLAGDTYHPMLQVELSYLAAALCQQQLNPSH